MADSKYRVTFNGTTKTYTVTYTEGSIHKANGGVVFSLSVKETMADGEVKYSPWLITSPIRSKNFTLTVPSLQRLTQGNDTSTVSEQQTENNGPLVKYILRAQLSQSSNEFTDVHELENNEPKLTILRLYDKAKDFISSLPAKMRVMNNMTFLYRNNTGRYFEDIFLKNNGIMKIYFKDKSGDPKCPINGKVKGLYFSSNVHNQSKTPIFISPFGPLRLLISLSTLLQQLGDWRLYFADFYCVCSKMPDSLHRVTLVLCDKGSEADRFCSKHLLLLPRDNPFLQISENLQVPHKVSPIIWANVFYTQEINVAGMMREGLAMIVRVPATGTPKPGGVTKNQSCDKCNFLSPESWCPKLL